jgi:hypothetical protein
MIYRYCIASSGFSSLKLSVHARAGLCSALFFGVLFFPWAVSAQGQDDSSRQGGAKLSISPLNTQDTRQKQDETGFVPTNGKTLPVPNKLGGHIFKQNEARFDQSWINGQALKKRSLLKGRAANEDLEGLSQEARLLLSLERSLKRDLSDDIFVVPRISSLFFTQDQYALLREAQAGFFSLREPSRGQDMGTSLSDLDLSLDDFGPEPVEQDTKSAEQKRKQQKEQKVRANYIRTLALNGVVYNGPDKWIVWLNNRRITPEDKFEQIVDMNVRENYVELRWYDGFNEKIFPVRLWSGQRFNLDTRNFASTSGGDAS